MKRRDGRGERFEELPEPIELGSGKAGADVAGVDEAIGRVVPSQDQRAEAVPRALGLGPAADDELILLVDFELEPFGTAPAVAVGRPGPLDEQPFPSLGLGAGIELAAIPHHLLADPERGGWRFVRRKKTFELRAPVGQRERPKVDIGVAEKVEGDKSRRLFVRS